ncbi:MAG: 16S rRNA (guanine527-N7)-methyltransferase [Candidatus Azotimanducaceae bacterium]|jgi:16S rRNA (guanine527-N7)-methyltransferase
MSANQALQGAIEQGMVELGLHCPADLVLRLERFIQNLVKWNKVYNLTSIRDPEAMVTLHLLDSLAVAPFLAELAAPARVLDVGSGAGLPGIPLAMYYPQLEFVLLDSNGKKTRFLQQMQIELKLTNVTVVQSRVEDYAGQFELILCRAFAKLTDISQGLQHLLADKGNLLAMKGKQEVDDALSNIADDSTQSALKIAQVHALQVPGIDAERHLYVLQRLLNNHCDVQPS